MREKQEGQRSREEEKKKKRKRRRRGKRPIEKAREEKSGAQ